MDYLLLGMIGGMIFFIGNIRGAIKDVRSDLVDASLEQTKSEKRIAKLLHEIALEKDRTGVFALTSHELDKLRG